jgi:hypothetical protein
MLAANVQSYCRSWHLCFKTVCQRESEAAEAGGVNSRLSFQVHVYRGDSTNSTTLHNEKVHSTELLSLYVVQKDLVEDVSADFGRLNLCLATRPPLPPSTSAPISSSSPPPSLLDGQRHCSDSSVPSVGGPSHQTFGLLQICDPQTVTSGSTGETLKDIDLKQFRSVGFNPAEDVGVGFTVFLGTTDAGADELKAFQLLLRDCSDNPHLIGAHLKCLFHQTHLIAKRGFLLLRKCRQSDSCPRP